MKTDADIRKDRYSNIFAFGWNYMSAGIGKHIAKVFAALAFAMLFGRLEIRNIILVGNAS